MLTLMAWLALLPSPDTTAAVYRRWCGSCHGDDGGGVAAAKTKLEVPPAPLADCRTSSAEPEALWVEIVKQGGDAFGLSLDMPAYGDAASHEQIVALVRYVKGLCRERGWPPGELNFPRPFRAEKAFPENEWVLVLHGDEQRLIYERRFGRRLQLEGVARSATDGGGTACRRWRSPAWASRSHRPSAVAPPGSWSPSSVPDGAPVAVSSRRGRS
jgi:hypothetical protein